MAKSDDEFPIPPSVNRTQLPASVREKTERAVSNVTYFEPTQQMEHIKARFLRRVEEKSHIYDIKDIFQSPALLQEFAGTKRIIDWMQREEFVEWFRDDGYFQDEVISLRGKSLRVIRDILDNDIAMDADKIKAAKMIMELSDAFPGRKQEVRFIDERLNKMSGEETQREIAKLRAELAGKPEALPPPVEAPDEQEEDPE